MSEKKGKELAEIVGELIEHCRYLYRFAIIRERDDWVLNKLIEHGDALRKLQKEVQNERKDRHGNHEA